MNDKVKELVGSIENIKALMKNLGDSTPLVLPDEHAGNLLVDPVVPAALIYWWGKFSEFIPDLALIDREKEQRYILVSTYNPGWSPVIPLAEAIKEE